MTLESAQDQALSSAGAGDPELRNVSGDAEGVGGAGDRGDLRVPGGALGASQSLSNLPAECLAAVLGIYPTAAPSSMQLHVAEVSRYVARLAGRVQAFLDAEKPGKFKWETPPEQTELYAKITEPLDPEKLGEWLADAQPEVAVPYGMIAQAARAKVKAAWPIYPDPSLGLHNFELAADEYMDVVQVMRTLDSPESIFDDLDALVLLPEQVSLVAEIFPELYAEIVKACRKALLPYLEIPGFVEKRKTLSAIKEEQIRTLMQLPTDVPIEAPLGNPQTGQPQQGGPKRSSSSDEGADDLRTPSEHTAAKRIAAAK